MKWLAVLFTVFIASIIILADLGFMTGPLRALRIIPYGDKVGHFVLIGTLTFLIAASLYQALPSLRPKLIAVSVAFILAVIFTIEEVSQAPIPGRDASWADLFSNYAGIFFFSFGAWFLNRKRKP